MKIKDGFILESVAGMDVVVPVDGSLGFDGMITLNDTSCFMWKLLENGISKEELVNSVCNEYDVDRATVEADVDAFIEKLKEAKILEE